LQPFDERREWRQLLGDDDGQVVDYELLEDLIARIWSEVPNHIEYARPS
jgi:hypothetical protein